MAMFAERYEILGELGRGGYGVVYRVRDHKLGRDMALKLLSASDEILAIREAHVLTGLESPHVLRVFNAGIHGDVAFITTEIASLGSTESQIRDGLGASTDVAVRWVRHALVGLDYCHRRRVLHRDLTPGNIFLDTLDHARLGDFGTAVALDNTNRSSAGGNQRVRAPECYMGDRMMDRRSEIFSAGVTLWRLLSGSWPFDAPTESDLHAQMVHASVRLRDAAPHVHRSIATVVERAIQPVPEDRYEGASAMADALGRVVFHERAWRPAPASGAVISRWEGRAQAGTIEVCVLRDGRRYEIRTVRLPSGNRIRRACMTVRGAELRAKLRRVFDTV